ncbi:FHA domain-containing protein [Saccharothrix xinjiangensis]|uniref:FHA domain-containing protein n=1 Tax=Saccharothrix xinjiangensis TaxID=204798 RepID=A0ABV9Y784_9PSEU
MAPQERTAVMALQRRYHLDAATPSLLRRQPLLGGAPAPSGTLFALGEDGGYAAAPHADNHLLLGRNSPDVHVTVGSGDAHVSREHAAVRFLPGNRWLLRNDGRLPIRASGGPPLLSGHETVLAPGYTPLYIRGSRLHVVELLVAGGAGARDQVRPDTGTRDMGWPLSDRERLVLVALFQQALLRGADPHPLSWRETGAVLNDVPGERRWTERKAEHVVDVVRRRLAAAGVPGITADSAPPEAIKRNLAAVLVETATLTPPDLRLLDTGLRGGRS